MNLNLFKYFPYMTFFFIIFSVYDRLIMSCNVDNGSFIDNHISGLFWRILFDKKANGSKYFLFLVASWKVSRGMLGHVWLGDQIPRLGDRGAWESLAGGKSWWKGWAKQGRRSAIQQCSETIQMWSSLQPWRARYLLQNPNGHVLCMSVSDFSRVFFFNSFFEIIWSF